MRYEIKNKHSHAPIIMHIYNIIACVWIQLFKVNFCHETIIIENSIEGMNTLHTKLDVSLNSVIIRFYENPKKLGKKTQSNHLRIYVYQLYNLILKPLQLYIYYEQQKQFVCNEM